MIKIRKADERGHFPPKADPPSADDHWLDTYHTFSFGDYYDPAFLGFRKLQVLNEDRVSPGQGFPPHSHKNMEIVTVILEGELQHKDSMGNGAVIRPGDVQYMSAGTGVTHSEFNPSKTNPVHLYQIWIAPEKSGFEPAYGQKAFSADLKKNKWCLAASPDGKEGSIKIRQDAKLFIADLDSGKELEFTPDFGRHAWIQIAGGEVVFNGTSLQASDGAAVSREKKLVFKAQKPSQILLFDLA